MMSCALCEWACDSSALPQEIILNVGHSQNHLAVAGGCAAFAERPDFVPTRYREVVLTVSK